MAPTAAASPVAAAAARRWTTTAPAAAATRERRRRRASSSTRNNAEDATTTTTTTTTTTPARRRRASPWPLLDAEDDARRASPRSPRDRDRDRDAVPARHWTVSAPFVDAETSATRAVATTADVSDALASELLDAGAVYVDWWPEGRRAGGDDDDESAARWRRLRGDVVRRGERVRVHRTPRRYRDACWLGEAGWRKRVVYEDEETLAVNKPHALPTQAHESNAAECVPGCVARALGFTGGVTDGDDALLVTHRLDASTSGVVVLGKTLGAVRAFNASIAGGKRDGGRNRITKTYVALVVDASNVRRRGVTVEDATTPPPPVPLGRFVHYMYPGPFGASALGGRGARRSKARLLRRRAPSASDNRGDAKPWRRCELVVRSCARASPRDVAAWRALFAESVEGNANWEAARGVDDGSRDEPSRRAGDDVVYEVEIELVTGRTHQVRAQLAALGFPILGDTLYAPMAGYLHDEGEGEGDLVDVDARETHASELLEKGVVPDWPVALHAASLRWDDKLFAAPPPWREDVQ